jgi:hypothetical protein
MSNNCLNDVRMNLTQLRARARTEERDEELHSFAKVLTEAIKTLITFSEKSPQNFVEFLTNFIK